MHLATSTVPRALVYCFPDGTLGVGVLYWAVDADYVYGSSVSHLIHGTGALLHYDHMCLGLPSLMVEVILVLHVCWPTMYATLAWLIASYSFIVLKPSLIDLLESMMYCLLKLLSV